MFEATREHLETLKQRLSTLNETLNLSEAEQRIAALESEMHRSGFWDNPESAQRTLQEIKSLKNLLETPTQLQKELDDAFVLLDLAEESQDPNMESELAALQEELETKIRRLEINSLFTDPRDSHNVILSIHPGAGGTESCDWADMLYRMITRYCENRGFQTEVLDYLPGEEAGIKSVTLSVKGPYAYGMLKSESGVHRLVRISPFDAARRRHTSFAAIEVLAEVDKEIQIDLREEDLKMEMYRSSGAGGQKVNKTSSAVRITHIPTGIVVACQIERSQHRNRALALDMLRAKLYDMEMRKKEAELMAQRSNQADVAWGSQIRSYVLAPYQLVKDHRTGAETGNVQRVLDGDLDMFVEAYLRWLAANKNRN